MEAIQNQLFDALSDERRRRILYVCLRREGPINIDSPPDGVDDQYDAAVERRHVHLPKLAEYEFIEWHRQASTVTRAPDSRRSNRCCDWWPTIESSCRRR
ncbi:hypothetical protein Htur_0748 [Haloterrigena turkmenica DSM 5511]|uniref:Transcriptional regulator, ArsR family n=1 Tax=Haloterrigena turkmenica (strain ATCC 51198 / DSM 5511 / JCM 9101 / NCIMB 13204 / VKM B-1734 / 4k) TaxID=543526 RepID=D2RX33_HALTV|nr:hypothetical protein Htur_0748 [Haloterrigena turkmenica DSM 5511]